MVREARRHGADSERLHALYEQRTPFAFAGIWRPRTVVAGAASIVGIPGTHRAEGTALVLGSPHDQGPVLPMTSIRANLGLYKPLIGRMSAGEYRINPLREHGEDRLSPR
jgi:hypothetical protein